MQLTPNQRKFLERLGINTTRLQWKLYQWEKRTKEGPTALRLPTGLHWLRYQHKFCTHCGALADRDATACPSCKRRLPSIHAYQMFRLLGLMAPDTGARTVYVFLLGMVALFALGIAMQGPSALMMPTGPALDALGGWRPVLILRDHAYWRLLSFGLVHIGVLHILFNFVALLQIGPLVEQRIGPVRMLTVVTLTQLSSAAATHFWYYSLGGQLMVQSAGASGWLFGLIGYGIIYFGSGSSSGKAYRQFLIQWAIYGLLFGLLMGANNAAHVGGMLGGMALALLPEDHPRRANLRTAWQVAFWVSLGLWIITLVFLGHSIITGWAPGNSLE